MIAEKRINNKIKNIVAKAAKSPNRDYLHVIYNYPNRWAVVKEGNVRALKAFSKRDSAISFATKNLIRNGRVIIHDRNGDIPSLRYSKVNGSKH